jgi:nitronate monooxygenase
MKTRITELFGIKHAHHPGAAWHFVGFARAWRRRYRMAGGLGIITGLTQKTPELLAKEIAKCRGLTDKPVRRNSDLPARIHSAAYPNISPPSREGGVKIVGDGRTQPGAVHAGVEGRGHQGNPQMHLGAGIR